MTGETDLSKAVEDVKAVGWQVYWHQPLGEWRAYYHFEENMKAWRYVGENGDEIKVLAEDLEQAKIEVVKNAAWTDQSDIIGEIVQGQEPEEIPWNGDWPAPIEMMYDHFISKLSMALE